MAGGCSTDGVYRFAGEAGACLRVVTRLRSMPGPSLRMMAKRSSKATATQDQGVDARWRVVLLAGKEIYLHAAWTKQIRQALEEAHGGVDVVLYDGATARPAEVLDDCRSMGLMQPYRLVIVDQADQFVKEDSRPIVERYAQAPSETATLVLRAEKWNKGKLDAMIESCGSILACDPPANARAWLADHAKRAGIRISPEAIGLLLDRVGDDLGRLHGELEKLSLAAGDLGGDITESLVAEMVGATREEDLWKNQSRLLSRDPNIALGHLHMLLDRSPREAAVPVAYMCMDLARKIHGCSRGMRQGIPPGVLSKDLRLWGAEAIFDIARAADPDKAGEVFAQAVGVDHRQKTGVGDASRALEVLTLRFGSLGR